VRNGLQADKGRNNLAYWHGLAILPVPDQMRQPIGVNRHAFVETSLFFSGGPIPPAIRMLDCGLVLLPLHLGPLIADQLMVIKELKEHDPSEHREPVEIAVKTLVLPHDVACGRGSRASGPS
jgi:hypothetical protein